MVFVIVGRITMREQIRESMTARESRKIAV